VPKYTLTKRNSDIPIGGVHVECEQLKKVFQLPEISFFIQEIAKELFTARKVLMMKIRKKDKALLGVAAR
jgi:hypothetical protein